MTNRADTAAPMRLAYLQALLRHDAAAAASVVDECLRAGWNPVSIYLDVLAGAERQLGTLWEAGELNVALEHWATQVTFEQMERLRRTVPKRPALGLRAIIASVPGNQHSLGARVVADFLEVDGWDVEFLGQDVPAASLVDYVLQRKPTLILLSVGLTEQLPIAAATLAAVRRAAPDTKLLVGGAGVLADQSAATALSAADAIASDALEVTALARRLAGIGVSPSLESYLATLGQRVQQLRRGRGWNQQQLADSAELDRAYISAVENGKQNLTLGAIKRLADALDVSLDSLLR